MKNILFSVVIPTYNSKNTIIKCIESCIIQTYEHYEIIVVDDCSEDNTVELIEKYIKMYQIENILIHKLDINSGASKARNVGISYAKGEYIALLDSDDFFHRKKLETVYEVVSQNSSVDLLGHGYYLETEINDTDSISENRVTQVTCMGLLLKNFAVTPSVVFKKSLGMYFNEHMRYTEDHEFFLRVCNKGHKIFYLDKKLVGLGREILSIGGQSSNNLKMRIGEVKMYINLYKMDLRYIFFIPFLVLFSLLKHVVKMIR